MEIDAVQAAHTILAGEPFIVLVEGTELEILPEEVEVRAEARSGLAVASEGSYLAALQTELTPELVREGLAREFVRRLQELRKQADFEIADRIQLYLSATPDLVEAIQAHREYILGETLTIELHLSEPPAESPSTEAWFDGHWMKIGITRVIIIIQEIESIKMTTQTIPPPSFIQKALAWGVHLFTATGAVWGLLSILAIQQHQWKLLFLWVALSLFRRWI